MTIRLSGATKLSHGSDRGSSAPFNVKRHQLAHGLLRNAVMNHQAKGAVIAIAFVAAFIASIALHSLVASVIVLLSGVTVAYVTGIAWMRTSAAGRVRDKQRSLP